MRKIHYLREQRDERGKRRTYEYIGRKLYLNPESIWVAFKKYKRDGYRWINRMKGHFKAHHIKKRKITGIIAEYILSYATLESWS